MTAEPSSSWQSRAAPWPPTSPFSAFAGASNSSTSLSAERWSSTFPTKSRVRWHTSSRIRAPVPALVQSSQAAPPPHHRDARAPVNSAHHQAVKTVALGMVVDATASDGVIEGIEDPSRRFASASSGTEYAISPGDLSIFAAFIRAAAA
jgi:hypothetical protein